MFDYLKNMFRTNKRSIDMIPLDQLYLNWLNNGGGDEQALRTRANPHSVKSIPAFFGGINKISDRCAHLPFELLKPEGDKRLPDLTNPVRKLGCKFFSGWLTRELGLKALIANRQIYGHGFALIHRNLKTYIPYELTIINPEFVQLLVNQLEDGRLNPYYRITIQGEITDYPYTDIIHIKGLNNDGISAFSVSNTLDTALNLSLNLYAHSEKYFERNCSLNMYMTTPPEVSIGSATKPQDFVNQVMESIRQGKPPLLTNGTDLKSFNDNASDAQLVEAKQASLTDMANILSAPISVVNGASVTSYASLEAQAKDLLDNTLNPILSEIESEFTNKLLTEVEKDNGICFEFDRSSLDTPSPTERTANVNLLLARGVISKHEARLALGYAGDAPEIEIQPLATDVVAMVAGFIITKEEARLTLGLTGPAPETPEPPPVIQQPPDEQKPEEEDNKRSIIEANLTRLFTRLKKSAVNYRSKDDNHRKVFCYSLPNNEAVINQFFDNLDEEIEAVSKQEYQKIINYRCENNKLLEELI